MACLGVFFLLFPFLFLIPVSVSPNPILPKAVFVPVTKDLSTLQYVARVFLGENLIPVSLVVDLNNPHVWLSSGLISASQRPVESSSLECSMVESIGADSCSNSKICSLQVENPVPAVGEVNVDRVAFKFWGMMGLDPLAKIEQFFFPCGPNLLLKGLANGAKGILGLGCSRISLPSQFFWAFAFFDRKFSLCLSSSEGGLFLGGLPFRRDMVYTPLVSKKSGYYITVKSIRISAGGLKLRLSERGVSLDSKLSTSIPYTAMESKIYITFLDSFVTAAASLNMTLIAPPVPPFGACFKGDVGNEPVPVIDLVLQSEMVKWRIHGNNSMVQVSNGVMCLGFVDAGLSPEKPLVIGGYQLEDFLLEFNLENSMLGFSTCPGFSQQEDSQFG